MTFQKSDEMKKVVVLEYKNEPDSDRNPVVYRSVSELARKEGRRIGIGLNSLWNALSRGKGVYENRVCRSQDKQVQ